MEDINLMLANINEGDPDNDSVPEEEKKEKDS